MTKDTKSVNDRLAMLEDQLRRLGIVPDEPANERPQPDYVQHGSAQHMAMIGLLEVGKDEQHIDGSPVYTSPTTGKTYRLEDPVTPFMSFPDPLQVAQLVLRQKVSVIEGGAPTVPPDAPPLWRPANYGL